MRIFPECIPQAHVVQLAAAKLLSQPGLLSVLGSFALYRNHAKKALGMSPHDWADLGKDNAWLR